MYYSFFSAKHVWQIDWKFSSRQGSGPSGLFAVGFLELNITDFGHNLGIVGNAFVPILPQEGGQLLRVLHLLVRLLLLSPAPVSGPRRRARRRPRRPLAQKSLEPARLSNERLVEGSALAPLEPVEKIPVSLLLFSITKRDQALISHRSKT